MYVVGGDSVCVCVCVCAEEEIKGGAGAERWYSCI